MVNKGGSGCTPKKQCGECQGDCDSNRDCGRGLKCFQRNGKVRIPGCEAGASGDVNNYDYCVKAKQDDPRLVAHWDQGTCGPGADDQNWAWCQKQKGVCPSSVTVSTSICSSGSAVLKEKKGAHTAGGCHFFWWAQYTCATLVSKGASGCSAAKKCARCAGDCDRDTDCQSGLKCFQRNRNSGVPGCPTGGPGDVSNYDYCYSPASLHNKGGSGCTPKKQCGACQGDCDSDRDCGRGLKCFQRNDKTRVPGCEVGASGDVKTYDYCVSPRDDPRLVAHWDSGTCGPGADDQNWVWCQKTKGACASSVTVAASICSSKRATLKFKKGDHTARPPAPPPSVALLPTLIRLKPQPGVRTQYVWYPPGIQTLLYHTY